MPNSQKKRPARRKGPIQRRYSEKLKKWIYGLDVRVSDGAGGKKRIRPTEFETKDEAEQALANIRRQEREGKYGVAPQIKRPALHDLIDKRIPTISALQKRTRARRVLYTLLSLLDPMVKLGDDYKPVEGYRSRFKVDQVKTGNVRLYVEKRLADDVSAASINRELATIAATLNQAGEIFPELEQWRPPKMPHLKVSKSRRERLVSNDEYTRLIAYLRRPADESDAKRKQNRENAHKCRVRVSQIFEFAMLTAARHGEIVGLKWSDIDWEREKILIFQRKAGDYKEVPLIPSLVELINERKPAEGIYVFTKTGAIYPKFYKVLSAACKHLGILYGRWIEDGLLLHTARHTVTTRLVEAGLDFDTIGMITGHRAKELIAHYAHKSPQSVARAAAALEKMGRERESGQKVVKKEKDPM
ncbi:MAG TPA: site-specific integrase [Blastocatellia bacterium]|nr:site-specific integrase [Blastocatellia bacterium]